MFSIMVPPKLSTFLSMKSLYICAYVCIYIRYKCSIHTNITNNICSSNRDIIRITHPTIIVSSGTLLVVFNVLLLLVSLSTILSLVALVIILVVVLVIP